MWLISTLISIVFEIHKALNPNVRHYCSADTCSYGKRWTLKAGDPICKQFQSSWILAWMKNILWLSYVWNLRNVHWKTFKLEMKNWTLCYLLSTGSVAPSLQFVYDPDKNSNSELFKHIIQPKSQFPDLIFSGELQHGMTFWMPLYLCNLRFWACKWDPLPLNITPTLTLIL